MAVSLCSQTGANTGGIDCDVTRGIPQVIIAGSKSFASADYVDSDTFEAAFSAAIKQAAGTASKLFPFPVIQGNTAKTEAAKYSTLGYGTQIKLLRSKPGYEFDVLAGSSLEKKLIAFDGKQVPLFILDDQSNVWGVQDASGNFTGATYMVGVEPRDFGDAQNAKTTKITISLVDSRDFVEYAAFMNTSFAASDLKGLNDVKLVEPAAHAANVHYIKTYVPTTQLGNGLDITADLGTALGSGALWSAKTGATYGTALTITSVSYDSTNERLVVTFDSTAYTALSVGDKIKLIPAAVPALDAADVTGVEIAFVILTKTA
jgi:hypothetical protein